MARHPNVPKLLCGRAADRALAVAESHARGRATAPCSPLVLPSRPYHPPSIPQDNRAQHLDLHLAAYDLELSHDRADTAEAALALASAQRDESVAQSQTDIEALSATAAAWKADKALLNSARAQLAAAAPAQSEMETIRSLMMVIDAEGDGDHAAGS